MANKIRRCKLARPRKANFVLQEAGIQLEEVKKSFLTQAFAWTQGNKTRAAGLLRLTRDTFRYRLEKYAIE